MTKNSGGYILMDDLEAVKTGTNFVFTDESAARLLDAAKTGKPIVINHINYTSETTLPGEVFCNVSGGFDEVEVQGITVHTMIFTGVQLLHAENGSVGTIAVASKMLSVNPNTGKAYIAAALTI